MYRQNIKYHVLSSSILCIITEILVLPQWFMVSRTDQDIIFKQSENEEAVHVHKFLIRDPHPNRTWKPA